MMVRVSTRAGERRQTRARTAITASRMGQTCQCSRTKPCQSSRPPMRRCSVLNTSSDTAGVISTETTATRRQPEAMRRLSNSSAVIPITPPPTMQIIQ